MANSELDIYNMALNAIGTRATVSITSEDSREAEVCRQWYGDVRDRVFRTAPWPSVRAVARLALRVEKGSSQWTPSDPMPGYQYAYNLPPELINPRFLAGYQRFEIGLIDDDVCLHTNVSQAVLTYTRRMTQVAKWDQGLTMAIVYALAGYISMPLHGKAGRTQTVLQEANNLIMTAREDAANTDTAMVESIPDWILARGYGAPLESQRFFYPYAPLFTLGELGVQ